MVIRTPLNKKDFNEILENYNIGKYKKSKHIKFALANTVYILETNRGKFVLKIFEGSQKDFIQYQIKIMKFLNQKKVFIPELIKIKNKKFLLTIKNKKAFLQRFVEGKAPKKIDTELIKDIADKIGLMNKNLLKLKLNGKFVWEKDHEFKPIKYKGIKINGFDFKYEERILLNELKKIKKNKLKKSVVHGDCHSFNLLVKGDKLKSIIDWDDVHEDYLVYEISAFITHTFIMTPLFFRKGIFNKRQLSLFLKNYQKHISLNEEEKKAIYYFIKQRFLQTIEWFSRQMKNHKDLIQKLKNQQLIQIKQYQFFNKIKLNDFLEFFEK